MPSYNVTNEQKHTVHPHDNVSDHLPLEITIKVDLCELLRESTPISYFVPWSTLAENETMIYRNTMSEALSKISVPFNTLNHAHVLCESCDCSIALETFYNDIQRLMQE